MQDSQFKKNNSARLFKNRFLEALTRTPFWLPIFFFYAVSAGILVFNKFDLSLISVFLSFILGLLLFTLVEYLIHRFLFHFNAQTEKQKAILFTIHGVHHDFPRDRSRLVMPIVLSITLATIFFLIFKILIPDFYLIFFSGFIAGYSSYLFIHYAVHAFRPPKNIFRYLWKHHALHHYKSNDAAFAVSFPLWDYIFGTMAAKK